MKRSLSISTKLYLVIAATVVAMLVSMLLYLQWSFHQGFFRYVGALEQERLAALADKLEGAYAAEGSWDFLQYNAEAWAVLLVATQPSAEGEKRHRQHLTAMLRNMDRRHHQMMHNAPRPFELRVVLLDANRTRLWGPADSSAATGLRPIVIQGQTVGHLGLVPGEDLTDERHIAFARQQKNSMILVALVVALTSIALCIPIARRLARPVGILAEGTHALAQGRYDTRLAVISNDELGELTRDFNVLAASLEKNEAARRQWIADISHELRTPLAVLRGEIEALQDGVRPVTPQHLESLHGETRHLGRLIDDLHQLALSDLGALNYSWERVDLNEILLDVLEMYEGRFAGRRMTLEVQRPNGVVPLHGDMRRLRQLLENLLENSLRYTDPGGQVNVSLGDEGDAATLIVEDSAPGVAKEDLPRLFERLFRVESSRSRHAGGSGLGLSICQNIVAAHNGSITAETAPLGGLRITVRLNRER